MNLYRHQQEIVDADLEKCGLWLGTGSGKTRIALLLAKGDTLVICPKTQKEDRNWEREYVEIVRDTVISRPKHEIQKTVRPRLTVMSKEEFRRDAPNLPRFNTVIVDEAHTCLGVTPTTRQLHRQTIPRASQLFEALDTYVRNMKPDRIYLATATIVKSPFTVWAAGRILGDPVGKYDLMGFFAFRDEFYTRLPIPGRDIYTAKKDNATKEKLARMVRRLGYVGRLEDYFDVPAQTFRTVHIELTAAQKARLKSLPLEFPDPLVLIGKRHQVENGVLSGDEFNPQETFACEKIDKILELAEEFPRMVVFCKYRAQIEQIQFALTKPGYKTWTLTGDTKDRGGVIKQAGELDGVLIVQAQISAGWEVPLTPVMVFASRSYSYVDYIQAVGRVQRANNIKKNLYINLVVKGGIDEAVDKALENKCDFEEKLYVKSL